MSFRKAVLNPSAIRLVEFIAAAVARMTVSTVHQCAYYQTDAVRSFEDGLPFINFRAILVAEEGALKENRDSLEMEIFASKRRMVQVCLKANEYNKLTVRFAEAHPNGEVFHWEDRSIDVSAVTAPGLLSASTLAATAGYYLATGKILDPQ